MTDKNKYFDDLAETLSSATVDGKDASEGIIKMLIENLAEIREYFSISKKQMRQAFVIACFAAVAGICLMIAAVIIGFAGDVNLMDIALTAIGGAVSTYISKIIFSMRDNAIAQMNKYYMSLHANEHLLMAVYLAEKLAEPDKTSEMKKIIEELLKYISSGYFSKNAESENAKELEGYL